MTSKMREIVKVIDFDTYSVEVFNTDMALVLAQSESGLTEPLKNSSIGRETTSKEGYFRLFNIVGLNEADDPLLPRFLDLLSQFAKEYKIKNDSMLTKSAFNRTLLSYDFEGVNNLSRNVVEYVLDSDCSTAKKWCALASLMTNKNLRVFDDESMASMKRLYELLPEPSHMIESGDTDELSFRIASYYPTGFQKIESVGYSKLRDYYSVMKMFNDDVLLSEAVLWDKDWEINTPILDKAELNAVKNFVREDLPVFSNIDRTSFTGFYAHMDQETSWRFRKIASEMFQNGELSVEDHNRLFLNVQEYDMIHRVINESFCFDEGSDWQRSYFSATNLLSSLACYILEGYEENDLTRVLTDIASPYIKEHKGYISPLARARVIKILEDKTALVKESLETGVPVQFLLTLEN